MKRKGFTLIELLAVIVILAIIALIAVPVIMNIISSARKSAFEDTAYGVISAGEMYYASALLENGMTSDVEFTVEDGAFVGKNKLEVKGALPTSGSIKVTRDGKVALAISNGAMCITKGYDDSKIDPEADLDNCVLPAGPAKTLSELARTNDFATSVDACVTSGTCASGTKFALEVAPGTIQNFYVVSDTNNNVTLIMDRDISSIEWINQNDYINAGGLEENFGEYGNYDKGPLTALNKLESLTSVWMNIEAKNYTITDSKYGTITRINARARLLTKTEALSLGCNNICPDWLYINNYGGYWLSDSSDMSSHASRIYYDGYLVDGIVVDNSTAIRPVIEISK